VQFPRGEEGGGALLLTSPLTACESMDMEAIISCAQDTRFHQVAYRYVDRLGVVVQKGGGRGGAFPAPSLTPFMISSAGK